MNADAALPMPTVAELALDAALHLISFPLLVLLLALLIRTASRGLAEIRLKSTAWTTILVMTLAFLLNTAPDGVLGLYQYAAIALISAIFIKRVFWIEIEHALVASLVFVFLSISLLDYARRGLDALIPERATITGTLANLVDERTRASTGDFEFPPSRRVLPAVLRSLNDPDPEAGLIADLMAPFRTLVKAKAQIADVDSKARDSASVVNMLSGAGTNVGDRASEMRVLEQSLAAQAAAGTLPPSSGGSPPAAPPSGFGATATYVPPVVDDAPAAAPLPGARPVRRPVVPPPPPASRDTFAESVAKSIVKLWGRLTGKPEEEPLSLVKASTPARPAAAVRLPSVPVPSPALPDTQSPTTIGPGAVARIVPPLPSATSPPPESATSGTTSLAAVLSGAAGPLEDLSLTTGGVDQAGAMLSAEEDAATPIPEASVTSTVAVAQGEAIVYVEAPADLRISGIVSRSDGYGFLTCNGKVVSVGGYVTSSAGGKDITLKLEAIKDRRPCWSLVVDTGAPMLIPLGGSQ